MEWGHDRRIPIDAGVFLDSDVVKAIVELKFNPSKGVAHLNSAAKHGPLGRLKASRSVRKP